MIDSSNKKSDPLETRDEQIHLITQDIFSTCQQFSKHLVLSNYSEEDVKKAIQFAFETHELESRTYIPGPYIEHPISVAKILVEEFDSWTYEEVMLAILHDTIESRGQNQKQIDESYSKIIELFDVQTANRVLAVSKKGLYEYLSPGEIYSLHHAEIQHRFNSVALSIFGLKSLHFFREYLQENAHAKRTRIYYSEMSLLPESLIKVKLADRLHNLRTLGSAPFEKRKEWLMETEEYFLPLAKDKYPRMYKSLKYACTKLRAEILSLEKSGASQNILNLRLDPNKPFGNS